MQNFIPQVEQLISKYSKWRFSKRENGGITIHTSDTRNSKEIQEILHQLLAIFAKVNFNIQVNKSNNTVSIMVLERPEKKYQRLFTSGCFDVFHFGHLNILERSKELCEYLIVGVSTDELIAKEKGRPPLIPFEERRRVIESLACVDEVIPQVDKNKQKIVDTYAIDAISVGDDWIGRYPEVSCSMEYLPYTKSISSTILKDSLKLTLHSRD